MEEAVEGCWIGHRARLPALAGSDIGSVYAPPVQSTTTLTFQRTQVETVLEVSLRPSGWNVICEKGGIRRVLMNLIGNSLKFTSVSGVPMVILVFVADARSERICAYHASGTTSDK